MIKRLFSTINSYSITITNAAWNKMDDIVKKSEMSKGAIYHYYSSNYIKYDYQY